MLHEILLALSGHPSPLFQDGSADFPSLTSTERALVASVGNLADIHGKTRRLCQRVAATHASLVCRAVATSIDTAHLSRFQQQVRSVEEQILQKDSSRVGAYDIVPLAGIVAEFDPWQGRMAWYCQIAEFLLPSERTASSVINHLRQETRTGYADIEQAAMELRMVAERAWLRQLSAWLLYGHLSREAAHDFFIARDGETDFRVRRGSLPHFIEPSVAASIRFIGSSLNLIKGRKLMATSMVSDMDLLSNQVSALSALEFPLTANRVSAAIQSIRHTFSQRTLRYLLPLPQIVQLLDLLAAFFLLGRGEFAVCLITEADRCLDGRKHKRSTTTHDSLKHLTITDGEISSVLARTWSTLLSMTDDQDAADPVFDLGRRLLSLEKSRASFPFDDVLLAIPVRLSMAVPSPMDLFLAPSDVDTYASIHSYLLTIRRGHMHLSQLWRHTTLRRDHPAPMGPPRSNSDHAQRLLKQKRERERARRTEYRKVWATCSAGMMLLSELGEYFEGQVVQSSWREFRTWIEGAAQSTRAPHDPESVGSAHRTFLAALTISLLLTDAPFTGALRSLIVHIQSLVASFTRLAVIRTALDLEADDGVVDALMDYKREEATATIELDRSRKRLDSEMKALVGRLRELDHGTLTRNGHTYRYDEHDEPYQPDAVGGLDRLLTKVDFTALAERDRNDTVYDLL